jgi:hypothetical protein
LRRGATVCPVPGETPGNLQALVWPSGARQLSGVFIPSLRSFTIPVPAAVGIVKGTVGTIDQVFLSSRALYVLDGSQLWTAPAPKPPPSPKRSAQ